MRIVNVHDDNHGFFQEFATAKRRVLVVDYDSVIAPNCAASNRGMPYPSISELLDCIMTTSRTEVVLVTGGQAADLAPLAPAPTLGEWKGAPALTRRFPPCWRDSEKTQP